jgi:antitoxin PrlF
MKILIWEDSMPIVALSSKGQITIPKQVRKALNLRPSEKVIIVVEGDQAIIKPLRGSLLDLGGSVKIPENEKSVDFRKIREEVKKKVAKRISRKG